VKTNLSFAGQVGEKVTIKVFVTLGNDAFKLPRLSPTMNNLQHAWFFGQDDTTVLETLG
jgi:hypothetical protein